MEKRARTSNLLLPLPAIVLRPLRLLSQERVGMRIWISQQSIFYFILF